MSIKLYDDDHNEGKKPRPDSYSCVNLISRRSPTLTLTLTLTPHPNEILLNVSENLRKVSNYSIDYFRAVIQQSSYIKMSKGK